MESVQAGGTKDERSGKGVLQQGPTELGAREARRNSRGKEMLSPKRVQRKGDLKENIKKKIDGCSHS